MIPEKHSEFIRHIIDGNSQSESYCLTYPNKNLTKGTVKVEASKLAKKYAKEIAQAQQINKDIVDTANKNAIGKTQEMRIISVARRMEILSDIAEGKIPLTKPMVCDGVIEEVSVVPDWMDRKAAIAELNKMDGSYAPSKVEAKVETTDKPTLIIDWSANANNNNSNTETK